MAAGGGRGAGVPPSTAELDVLSGIAAAAEDTITDTEAPECCREGDADDTAVFVYTR